MEHKVFEAGCQEKPERTQNELAQERTSLAEHRTDLAVEQTSLAFERTSLANSQTLLSYIRTAIGVFAAGIGMFEFVENIDIVHIGIILMAVSPVLAIAGIIHYIVVRARIQSLKDHQMP